MVWTREQLEKEIYTTVKYHTLHYNGIYLKELLNEFPGDERWMIPSIMEKLEKEGKIDSRKTYDNEYLGRLDYMFSRVEYDTKRDRWFRKNLVPRICYFHHDDRSCPKCDSENHTDEDYMIDENDNLITHWYECKDCGHHYEITTDYM